MNYETFLFQKIEHMMSLYLSSVLVRSVSWRKKMKNPLRKANCDEHKLVSDVFATWSSAGYFNFNFTYFSIHM